ncbi:MAG: PfkB family carbohydrate kinase [Planctomycetota bacterium]
MSKTRVMVGAEGRSRQQVLRIDREPSRPPRPETREELRRALPELLAGADAIVLSDYGYGVLDRSLVEAVLAAAGDRIVVGDSRYDLPMMRGVSIAKPNHAEAEALVGHPVVSEEECRRAGPRLLEMLDVGALLLTRGNRGMMLLERGEEPVFIPAADLPGEVTDVSGAGDTVVSLLALSLAAGADFREAAELSNIGAGVVVGKLGAATVSPTELVNAAMRIGG